MKKRKIASVFLSLCLITSLVSYPTQAEEKNTNKMLVHYDFNELNGDVAEEAVIKDISGNGHDAVAKGSGLTAEEGILSFPGGNYGSDAGFVELPKGLFDGKTDLTVSIWMKNETGAGNYTGFYIGTPADNDTNYPPSYFLLNPCNPSNVMKAVITNSVNAFGPFNTEVGLGASGNASDSFKTDNSWSLYTVVFTENTLTGYLNGQKYKTYNIEQSIADLGTDLLSYVGKSPYQDQFYNGGVKELQIYEMALSDEEVEELYLQELSDEEVLWKAESEVVTDEGVVKASGKETSVVLTATLSYGQAVREKKITVTIIPGGETQYSMVVDPENKGVEISQSLIGLFFEDINSAADGGINPELVKNSSFENYFNVASIEEKGRGNQYSWKLHWASDNGSYTNTYGYMQSFGFGYHEMLQLCEDMGAEPFPILSAGVFCQFSNGDNAPAASGEELDKFAQHATHLIDYCWGNPESDNKTQAEWAGKRVENGHQEPFRLNYIGIGNENWSTKYFDNFEYIKEYVEKYVENNYPERSITIISSSGPAAEDGSYQYAWKRLNEKSDLF